jgi:hypothetical protein
MVTYAEMFQFCILIVAIIGLFITIQYLHSYDENPLKSPSVMGFSLPIQSFLTVCAVNAQTYRTIMLIQINL